MFACIHCPGGPVTERLLDCAYSFSPLVEETAADTVLFDIHGLGRLLGDPESIGQAIAQCARDLGLDPNVAVAGNPDAALLAARGFPGLTVIAPGREGERLGELPLELLPMQPQTWETVDRWGIRTFGEFAALPGLGIAERLGDEGVLLQRLASGTAHRPLVPITTRTSFEDRIELEHPLSLLEPLMFLLGRSLGELCERLRAHSLATNEIRLTLELEKHPEHLRIYRLPVPMSDSKAFLKLLQLDLDANRPQAPVTAVSLSMHPVNPRVVQHGLFQVLAPDPEKLELTLARIAVLVGQDRVGTPELLDTHRPDAFRMVKQAPVTAEPSGSAPPETSPLALRRYRPPLQASVEAPHGRPVNVRARGVSGRVATASGPWRSSGDWWTPDAWARDEWDLALESGIVCRIFCERDAWFVEGYYD